MNNKSQCNKFCGEAVINHINLRFKICVKCKRVELYDALDEKKISGPKKKRDSA